MKTSCGLDLLAYLKSQKVSITGIEMHPETRRIEFDMAIEPSEFAAMQMGWLNSPERAFLREYQDLQYTVREMRGDGRDSRQRRQPRGRRPERQERQDRPVPNAVLPADAVPAGVVPVGEQ